MHGFDINEERIKELQDGHDRTHEIADKDLQSVSINYSADPAVIAKADIIIVAIPTPVDNQKKPDLTPLKKASETVGKHIKKDAIVVYESTVYPGTTEEICGPILAKESGMECGKDFFLGYSPERVNPGDKEHTIDKIVKIVAGQDEKTTDALCDLYGSIVTVGIHRAPNIKTAEMGKAIENAQRDLNIAFVNEVALLCHAIGIDTQDVLDAAGTKWNFLKFQPGLVGGHCIGVDPYYLVEKAEQLGMKTQVISAGRSINDSMAKAVVDETIAALNVDPNQARILVLGLTFKENVPDARNSKSYEVTELLRKAGCDVISRDPYFGEEETTTVDQEKIERDLKNFVNWEDFPEPFDAITLLVPHKEFLNVRTDGFIDAVKEGGVIYDLKSVLDKEKIETSGRTYLAL